MALSCELSLRMQNVHPERMRGTWVFLAITVRVCRVGRGDHFVMRSTFRHANEPTADPSPATPSASGSPAAFSTMRSSPQLSSFGSILTWPHFRPLFTLGSLEVPSSSLVSLPTCVTAPPTSRNFLHAALLPARTGAAFARALFALGLIFAIVLENYWIADEIYPYANQARASLFGGTNSMWSARIASNLNFPAPLAVLGFLAAIGISSSHCFRPHLLVRPQAQFARIAALAIAAGRRSSTSLCYSDSPPAARDRSRPRTGKILLRDRLPPRLLRRRRRSTARRPLRHHPPHPLR